MIPFARQSITLLVTVGLALAASTRALGQATAQDDVPEWAKRSLTTRVVHEVAGADTVVPVRGIVYKRDASIPLRLDLYRPAVATAPPVVLLVHGYVPNATVMNMTRDFGFFTGAARNIAASGLAAVTFGFRHHTLDTLETAGQDVRDAIAYLREHAGELRIDPERVALWVVSNGGPMLSIALDGSAPFIRCAVAWDARLDLQNGRGDSLLEHETVSDDTLRRFSPVFHLRASQGKIPPILVAQGALDTILPLRESAYRFVDEALVTNAPVSFYSHHAGGHGFLTGNDDDRTREILVATLDFLRRHLLPRPALPQKALPAADDVLAEGLVFEPPGMKDVVVTRDVVYRTVQAMTHRAHTPELKLDVYQPPGLRTGEQRPLVVLVHGGVGPAATELPRKWGAITSTARMLAAEGFVSVVPEHRLTTSYNLYDAAGDLAAAVAYARTHAGEWHADPNRVALWFNSAGGPLMSVPLRESPDWLRCIVGYVPYLDLDHLRASASAPNGETLDTLRRYSPRHLLEAGPRQAPPILVARGGIDAIFGINPSISRFFRAAVNNHHPIALLNHPVGEHGFTRRQNDHRTIEIVQETIGFIRRHTAAR